MEQQVFLEVNNHHEMPIFVKWHEFLKWLFPLLDKVPKKARFSITNRIQNLSLDIVELLIEARYSKNKIQYLKDCNLKLEKMRILIRLCFEFKFISQNQYEYCFLKINEVGKMLGGWLKQQNKL
jgi:hypothetical protein